MRTGRAVVTQAMKDYSKARGSYGRGNLCTCEARMGFSPFMSTGRHPEQCGWCHKPRTAR